mgnify:CR=1 FL=1
MGFTDNNIAPILGQSLSFLTFIDLKFGSWIDLNIRWMEAEVSNIKLLEYTIWRCVHCKHTWTGITGFWREK